jgi:hypothetical protein
VLERVRGVLMVEAGPGQLEDEMRLALSYAEVNDPPPIERVQHFGGVLPQQHEIVDAVNAMAGAAGGVS